LVSLTLPFKQLPALDEQVRSCCQRDWNTALCQVRGAHMLSLNSANEASYGELTAYLIFVMKANGSCSFVLIILKNFPEISKYFLSRRLLDSSTPSFNIKISEL
jgi:hypothetical protein